LGFTGRVTVDSSFWRVQAQRLVALRQDGLRQVKRPLGASYHPEGWGLDNVYAFRGRSSGHWLLDNGTMASVEEFKSIAGVCAVALGSPNSDTAWVTWLDRLRRESVDFKPAELLVDSYPREWRPEPDFEVVVSGLVWEPLAVRPDPDAEVVSTELGEIDDVCGASERVCGRLADEALKVEMIGSRVAPSHRVASGSSGATAGNSPTMAAATADTSRAMTLREAAKALRVSEDTLQRMQKRRKINMFKVGSRWRVLASEVIRLRQNPRFEQR
jgi:excisionase family DNA binding protein